MPGIENLKKFSEDITQIGDEVAIRQENGTTMPEATFPDNVPQEDDSYDFEFGLPEPEKDYDIENEEKEPELSADEIIASMAAGGTTASPAVSENVDSDVTDILSNLTGGSSASADAVPFDATSLLDDISGIDAPASASPIEDTDSFGLDSPSVAEDDGLNLDMPSFDDIEAGGGSPSFDGFGSSDDMSMDMGLPGLDDGFEDVSSTEGVSLDDGFGDVTSPDSMSMDDGFGDFSSSADAMSLDDGFGDSSESSDFSIDDGFGDSSGTSDFDLDLDGGFDTSGMEDFDAEDTSFSGDFDDGGFDDSNFEIPGFSDAEASDSKKSPLGIMKKKEDENKERDHLTDAEYELFKTNLKTYPLNVRLAIDKVIVSNEFTDTAVMEVLFKIVKKLSARKIATHLEKMLDITIDVPLNYERRTVEQYEAYKLSLEYQLKNRIIPGAIATLILGAVLYILFYLGATFIYRPIRAEILYNEGYALIENDLYAQSEIKFNEALSYRVKKSWFFKYAQGYREKNQYERARNMYNQLVMRFNYDKEAALEYARMELEDLANYERAAEITRRYVLDNYINDEEAMLLLGDIYLDWATSLPKGQEKDDRFEQARLQYSTIMDLYGQTDLYLSRMLRYFIRTDNLREVLTLKSYFFSTNKVPLEAPDLVELGGYLLEKRYGYLPPSDEYLRGSIENLRDVLELAVETDETIPEAHYNFARYFVYTNNTSQAIVALNNAIINFEIATRQTHERTLKHVDSYRLLGEIYTTQEEYLLAEEEFAAGIRLFERAQQTTGLIGNTNVGILFSNMGDLDYFISGDLHVALENYMHAIENYNDTASIRYKIGYIQYNNENFSAALNSFVRTATEISADRNVLLSLGNVLSIRNDDSAAASHYERLLGILNGDRDRYGVLFPQVQADHAEIVDLYLKTTNNLGVTLTRLADRTGNTALQAEAMGHFTESLRAWDSLTRNQETMVRLEGSNLAEQNIKYLLYPISDFSPAIYASIPRTLYGEEGLTQTSLN